MRENSDSTAVQASLTKGNVPLATVRAALTPELRTQLQICLTSVETLTALELELPPDAHRCVASIERAVGLLAKGLTGVDPSQIADSWRHFR